MILIVDLFIVVFYFCFILVLVYVGYYLIVNDYGFELL